MLEVPDFHAELEASVHAAQVRVSRSQRMNAVRLLLYAADKLAHDQFASIEEVLEFVLDETL
jgi:hypothetical protein